MSAQVQPYHLVGDSKITHTFKMVKYVTIAMIYLIGKGAAEQGSSSECKQIIIPESPHRASKTFQANSSEIITIIITGA